jgi:hypothetical protein
MRTTVDIPDPLDEQLRTKARDLGITFREALTRAIAAGLPELDRPRKTFTVKSRACGWKPGIDPNHLNRLADELDDESRELW